MHSWQLLEEGVPANEDTWLKLMAYCKKNFARYAMPYDIEFRDELPKTLGGKIKRAQIRHTDETAAKQ